MKKLFEMEFDAAELIKNYPPVWFDDNKELVYKIACSTGYPFEGKIGCTRWGVKPIPEKYDFNMDHTINSGFFDYKDSANDELNNWYMNFGDPNIFVAYSSELLAQDELQVAEHPILGSIREIIVKEDLPIDPVDETGSVTVPTPVTITNVQRRCAIDTEPHPENDLPYGLYGNNFATASKEQIETYVKALDPPTISNILVMASIAEGNGAYTIEEIEYILSTAYTGFSAIKEISGKAVIHTGYWGCGAFGGNKELMAILQFFAADLAGIKVVFWAGDNEGTNIASTAMAKYNKLRKSVSSVRDILNILGKEKYLWGEANGT